VEAAGAREHLGALLRRSLLIWAAIVVAALVVLVPGARLLLELAGPGYADHGVELLRLVGLSAPFTALVVLYCTLTWLDQRVWLLAGFQAVAGVLVLTLTVLLLPRAGLIAVGWAYLATQAVTAAGSVPFTLRWMRRAEFREVR
jgi:O-antigen/teichoic acid export membrane protein